MSRKSRFGAGEAIRGGVPLVFPQFGTLGPLRQHGFGRRLPWGFVGAESTGEVVTATLRLQDSGETRREWPHRFRADLIVALGARELAMTLAVTNEGDSAFSFTVALHTYLAVADLSTTYVEGLAGLHYRDHAAGDAATRQVAPRVDFPGEVDRLYLDVPAELRLVEADAHDRDPFRRLPGCGRVESGRGEMRGHGRPGAGGLPALSCAWRLRRPARQLHWRRARSGRARRRSWRERQRPAGKDGDFAVGRRARAVDGEQSGSY